MCPYGRAGSSPAPSTSDLYGGTAPPSILTSLIALDIETGELLWDVDRTIDVG